PGAAVVAAPRAENHAVAGAAAAEGVPMSNRMRCGRGGFRGAAWAPCAGAAALFGAAPAGAGAIVVDPEAFVHHVIRADMSCGGATAEEAAGFAARAVADGERVRASIGRARGGAGLDIELLLTPEV